MIQLRTVSKSFDSGSTFAVRNVDLQIAAGEFMVLLGVSGSGKTTTLKMINRLTEITSGCVLVDNRDVATVDTVELRRSIGYVFQGVGLFPHYQVSDNVAAVPTLLGWDANKTKDRVDELLELVGLPPDEFRNRYPHQLSGGQQQRVGVARALAAGPKVMLMDEPFGSLDPINRDRLQKEFSKLHGQLGLTVLMVTHDMTEALLMADRIAVLERGSVVQIGTPHQLMNNPAHPRVAELMAAPKRQAERLEKLTGPGAD